ncbi:MULTISPECIES: hypothetical protein [Streptomyces]|uniref:Uncharacterized protein n=1 Tax=Streptomyces abikoensis TaxID=97398 RepID=A0ABW7TH93_9ACTN|nr:hypothetical protein [Streptomyces sp. UNOB3_S3]MCC3776642.1 hypothetical protein [Streptomyces sp. UNOB3_S3]
MPTTGAESPPRLTYTLVPDHLAATAKNTELTLKAENRTGRTVTVYRITLRIPQGSGEKELTGQKAGDIGINVPADWEPYRLDTTRQLEIGIKASDDEGIDVPHKASVSFTLTRLAANGAEGQVTVTACEKPSVSGTPRTRPMSLSKTSPEFVFRDFRPDPYMVDADHPSTNLVWTTQRPAQTDAVYWLTHSTPTGESPRVNVSNVTSYALSPLHDTICLLKAELTPKKGPAVTASLTSTVLVANSAVQAARLTADRAVRLLNRPLANGGPVTGYTPSDWRAKPISPAERITTDTDGLLLATARSQDSGKAVTLTLDLHKGPTSLCTMTTQAGLTEQTLSLPVPADHAVAVTTSVSATDPDNKWYLVTLDWRPFGGGRLTR